MSYGRVYTMSFTNATLAAPQDLFAVYSPSNTKCYALLSVSLGQVTATAVSNQRVRITVLSGGITPGTGGSAGTLIPWDAGDAAPTLTGRINDTVQASGDTSQTIWQDSWNIINGWLWLPQNASRPPVFSINTALVVSLDSTPNSLVTNGSITVEEIG